MKTRLLFAFTMLAIVATTARASFYFYWSAPSSVNVGEGYTVAVEAYFTPSYYDDPYAVLGLYRNGAQVGGGSTGAYGSAAASTSFNDGSPQTVEYSADTYSYYGESDYTSHYVTVNGAPANNPPSAWVNVDGYGHGDTVTRPYGGSTSVTIRYKASDGDGNLARIRPQVWHPGSGYFTNDGGGWTDQSGGYGEVVRTITLDQDGDWYFWTDAEDSPGVFVNSGPWGDAFRLTVVQGAPPNSAPTVTLLAPGAQTIALGTNLTLTGQATDPDGNIAEHNLDIQRPDGNWNWYGGFAYGEPYMGGPVGSGSSSTRSVGFTFDQVGTWYVRSYGRDSANASVHSATVAITVVDANQPPTGTVRVNTTSITTGQQVVVSVDATDANGNLHYIHIDQTSPTNGYYGSGDTGTETPPNNGAYSLGGYFGSRTRDLTLTLNTPGTYVFRGAMNDDSGWYYTSNTVSVIVGVPPDTTSPGVPQNLQISNSSSSGFTISWSTPSGEAATGYRLRLNSGGFTEVGNVLSHTFSGLAPDTAYIVEVQACDVAGNWSDSASYGYSTGGGGTITNLPNASVWQDVDNDGIYDEIVRPNTDAFDYSVGIWSTPVIQYAGHPLNNFWAAVDMVFFSGPRDDFGWKFADSSAQYYVTVSTHFGLFFDLQLEANQPFALYRDLTNSDQIAPGNWEYILGSATGPGYSATHEFFWEVPNPFQLVNSKYFLVKYGQSVSKVQFKDSAGNVLPPPKVGAGGTASVNLPSNGELMIPVYDDEGREIPIEEGKHTLSWAVEGVINGISSVIQGVGKVLDFVGVAPLANGHIVVTLRLDDGPPFTFLLVLQNSPPTIEFRAKDGRLDDGFDRPLVEPQDQSASRIWHTSVAKAAPHNVNDVVKIVFSSAELATQYELFVPESSVPHVDVTPKVFTSAETDLVVTGKNGGTNRFEAEVFLRKKSNGSIFGKLIVDVMPWREIEVKVFKVEPGSILSRGQVASTLPSRESIQSELNARFRQACISFNVGSAIESEYFDYDNGPTDGVFQMIRWTNNGSGLPTASRAEVGNMINEASRFNGQLNVVFVKLLGDTNTDATQFPEVNQTTSNSTSGVNFFGDIPIGHVAFIAADYPNFQQPGAEDQFGAVRSVQRVIAHEVGHALGLSTREIVVSEILGLTEKHDSETVPAGTRSLLRSGPSGPPGKWMRHEDWRKANEVAGGLTQ